MFAISDFDELSKISFEVKISSLLINHKNVIQQQITRTKKETLKIEQKHSISNS
jgi:hypothetical protein